MILDKFPSSITTPSRLWETEQFEIKLADRQEELDKAFRLRYEVFNLEQGKGLKSSNQAGRDVDEFDEYCLHLLVIEKKTGNPIGTYRVHLGSIANSAKGFYSSTEYKIQGLPNIVNDTMELGRSCVSPEFRNGSIVSLLWGGIGELLRRTNLNIMIGCVSLEETDPAVGWALYRYLQKNGKITDSLKATALKDYVLPHAPEDQINKLLADERELKRKIPPLFKGYIRLNALICGEPAFDRNFGTIDFLIYIDKRKLPERYFRHYCENPEA